MVKRGDERKINVLLRVINWTNGELELEFVVNTKAIVFQKNEK